MKVLHYDDIYSTLLSSVIGQDQAAKALSLAIYKYQLKMYSQRELKHQIKAGLNLLLMGPTGSGKTYLMETAAKLLGIPIVIINSKSISQEGWHGTSFIEHIFNGLPCNKGDNAIVVVDEFDKMLIPNDSNKGDANLHVQHSILKYIEGAPGYAYNKKIYTEDMLFVFTGAFSSLYTDRERAKRQSIGYTEQENKKPDTLEEELVKFGMIPELLGRISQIIELNKLTHKDYMDILRNPNFPFNSWLEFFDRMTAEVDEDLDLQSIADEAVKRDLGVRGLIKSCERFVDDLVLKHQNYFKYRMQTDYTFKPDTNIKNL